MQETWNSYLKTLEINLVNDTVRIINPTKRQCCFTSSEDDGIAPFDYELHKDYYSRCLAEWQSLYHLSEAKDDLLLYTFYPIRKEDTAYILEVCSVVSKRLDICVFSDSHAPLLKAASRLSHIDDLTDLYNRRFIHYKLPLALNECIKNMLPFSLIFIDLDFFKATNDRYGHAAGDFLLYEFSRQLELTTATERCDWIARYGGDEFLICLSGAGTEETMVLAEKIRSDVEKRTFHYEEIPLKITCSIGTYTLDTKQKEMTVGELLDAVDRHLYRAKRSGKNQVQ